MNALSSLSARPSSASDGSQLKRDLISVRGITYQQACSLLPKETVLFSRAAHSLFFLLVQNELGGHKKAQKKKVLKFY